ncbi:MAG: CarD-like/TRCF domain protein [Firmicutes bacterium ADurb.Bin182]|nr:MAG: CarD-like/TRCF domain protein [Firmicutes bacterium ADurb.Bin182]
MYEIGDLVVYGRIGVYKIVDIATYNNDAFYKNKLYYVLQPLFGNCKIFAPVDTKTFMRPIISAEEAEKLISRIPTIEAEAYYSNRLQELIQHYESAIKDHDCADLIKLTMSIHKKKKITEQQKRKFGQIDERFLKQAEDLLCSEFSLALGIPKEKVSEYIAERVEAIT